MKDSDKPETHKSTARPHPIPETHYLKPTVTREEKSTPKTSTAKFEQTQGDGQPDLPLSQATLFT